MKTFIKIVLASAAVAVLPSVSRAQVMPNSNADIVCLAQVTGIDSSLPLTAYRKEDPIQSTNVDGVVLHLHVLGNIIGQALPDISVLASAQNLHFHGYVWSDQDQSVLSSVSKAGQISSGKIQRRINLTNLVGLFQIQVQNASKTFYLSESDRVMDSASQPNTWYVKPSESKYALAWFADKSIDAIYPTKNTAYDKSLPDGLKLLDFYANEALADDQVNRKGMVALSWWIPARYSSQLNGGQKPFLDSVSEAQQHQWFTAKFSDAKLSKAQQDDQDLLCYRAEWGDTNAYARFRKAAIATGKPSRLLWLPSVKDPELWLNLAKRSETPEDARVLFRLLERAPESKAKILRLAQEMLGRSRFADEGILDCIYQLTKDPGLAPDSEGMRRDIETQRQAAKRVISKELDVKA